MLLAGGLAADPGDFDALVRTTAERLDLADDVARSKFVRGQPVLDAAREAIVLDDAVRKAGTKALSADDVRRVMTDQMEASKWIQYALIARWRVENAQSIIAPDLAKEVRPRLDALQGDLLQNLEQARTARATPIAHRDSTARPSAMPTSTAGMNFTAPPSFEHWPACAPSGPHRGNAVINSSGGIRYGTRRRWRRYRPA
ncbi:gamma subclass chorismate mutase AroQ [Tahibacter amnicola]|uniref:chorismate mutase n=1 Tax=Tahibacter amnicola TaxID=2976241 RepID=A0ABY6BF47_9GAMM|nr:gamma subclass chorismate mutase AroQ [Tahibacter amnicola]UXI67730.1 gamma subclass chorismate mutase AroQ [Tahibacter amnicola]